ncbi:hypothetical protein OEA41_009542 [Lepraria neglecta]|uniref:GTP-binding protein EsdC n=1 Tax=Lepraria neglecta TaxID=209136 RepID=A0AAE0DHR3_9LECA|nr:hypothetical protein OEA41_009542 [Lepraria neglecta]
MSTSTQLSFTLSTSSKSKTVHLLGSWDNYKQQLPLACKEKAGKFKGTFSFKGTMLKPGSRYWYYYLIDGYHPSHDPSVSATKEPTTGRMLNILDVAKGGESKRSSTNGGNRASVDIPKGRSLSPSRIAHPKPSKPYASRGVREADYSMSPGMDDLTGKLEQASLYNVRNISPPSSVGSSLSSRSSDRSSLSSLSSLSDPSSSSGSCQCNRYGVTRKGDRVRLDCGGKVCGYGESSSDCSSDSESDSESEDERPRYQEIRPRGQVSSGRGRR